MPEHDAAIQLNLAWSRQEVKRRNNKLHPVTFQNKTLRVDTSTHCEATGGDLLKAEQNHIGAATQRTCIQWKLGSFKLHHPVWQHEEVDSIQSHSVC